MSGASGGSSDETVKLCRYFVNGVCKHGDNCRYSHDRQSPPDNICTFYQRNGSCHYDKACRYDHIKPKKIERKPTNMGKIACTEQADSSISRNDLRENFSVRSSSSTSSNSTLPNHPSKEMPKPVSLRDHEPAFNINAPAFVPSWIKADLDSVQNYARAAGAIPSVAVRPLCPYFEIGDCPKGEKCVFVHGLLCEYCLKACLHPDDFSQQNNHIQECVAGHKLACDVAFAKQNSAKKECGICLEKICEKDLRFGILENCTHCFCLSCIRDWRKTQDFENNVTRSCPECRVLSNFVIPSVVWVEEESEKKILVDGFRENTGKKQCKYYQLGRVGDGCPFGNKCFYKHQLPDGSIDPGKSPRSRRKPLLAEFIFDEEQDQNEFSQYLFG